MSTYQPPGGPPPDGTPSYAQPQDPWAGGFEQGVASVPTDPIPQQYDSYVPGAVPGEVWAQQTVVHGGQPYAYVPQPQRSKAGVVIAVFLAVLVLGGGGGYAAYYVTTHRSPTGTNPTAGPTTPNTTVPAAFDPYAVKVGDCLVNKGTAGSPSMSTAKCTDAQSYKVLKVTRGADIPEGADGKFDAATTSVHECAGTGYQSWYGYKDAYSQDKDLFFCLANN
jgi:hypothetical protein